MRGMLLTFSAVFALVVLAAPADAQFSYGAQGAVITSIDDLGDFLSGAAKLSGTFGLGVRTAFQPPALPIGVVAQGVYYFTDAVDYDYLTYSLAAKYRISTPVISPYALGGWQWRRTSTGGTSTTENGAMFGLGVQLNVGISLFLEGTYEFNDELTGVPDFDTDPIVIKAGIMLGS